MTTAGVLLAVRIVLAAAFLAVVIHGELHPSSSPDDGVTWSPYRPVYGHVHRAPMRLNNQTGSPTERIVA